jgi:ClpP class serine protease
MKQLPRLSALLYATPWAILPTTHGELGQLYRSYLTGTLAVPTDPSNRVAGAGFQAGEPLPSSGGMPCGGISWDADRFSRIACIYASGVVTKKDPGLLCGPSVIALDQLDSLVSALGADDTIDTVVLVLDSPGGSTVGLVETAEALTELAEEKRLVAFTDSEMCSAAYWLACACGEIYASPSSIVGSIGTYLAAVDSSRAWEMEGLELKLFRVGTFKGAGLEGKKWTPDEEKWLTDLTEKVGAEFRGWVSSRRPSLPADAMEGQFFFAKSAPAGLIDGLHRDLPSLLSALMEAPEEDPEDDAEDPAPATV